MSPEPFTSFKGKLREGTEGFHPHGGLRSKLLNEVNINAEALTTQIIVRVGKDIKLVGKSTERGIWMKSMCTYLIRYQPQSIPL